MRERVGVEGLPVATFTDEIEVVPRRAERQARRINPRSPSSPFPFVKPRNGGAPETLRRARAWVQAGK